MFTRGVRGATTAAGNDAASIVERTAELLAILIRSNDLRPEDVACAIFTVTDDLDAEFPAIAVRSLPGWTEVPLLCGREIPVPGSPGLCVRVLIHWNTPKAQGEIRHAFLHGARELRPQWAVRLPGDETEEPVPRLPGRTPP
ncbi:MAG TPA: chorismate mutase [Thermoanaerobaculia bacterium]|jgi:chorismate mutase